MAIKGGPLGPEEDGDVTQHPQPQPQPQPQQQQQQQPNGLHQHSLSNASTAAVDIEAWTVAALESLSIAHLPRGVVSTLSLPVESQQNPSPKPRKWPGPENGTGTPQQMTLRSVAFDGDDDVVGPSITPPRRPPSRRDSLRRREALLKGKEGSRQRRRWENDRLLHVPNVQPPLPSDWSIAPTHRVLPTVPYQLAHYYDTLKHTHTSSKGKTRGGSSASKSDRGDAEEIGRVTRDLRLAAKHTPAVKSWLRVLEEPVRAFVVERGVLVAKREDPEGKRGEKDKEDREEGVSDTDSDEEEIVFAGRRGLQGGKGGWKPAQQQQRQQREGRNGEESVVVGVEKGMVLDTMDDEDEGGAFKRWLTHSISDYYGLNSKSVMMGNPARRVVYVGVKQKQLIAAAGTRHKPPSRPVLPPPLWEMF